MFFLLHNLPCRAVAHADDVHAALHAVASLSIKAIDSLHISHLADGIALNAARSKGQDSSETAPGICCLVGSQRGFGDIERGIVNRSILKYVTNAYRCRNFACHGFER